MATSLVSRLYDFFKTVTLEEVTDLKKAAENVNAQNSTINWVRVFEKLCDENSLEKNMEMILLEHLDKILERFLRLQDSLGHTSRSVGFLSGSNRVKICGAISFPHNCRVLVGQRKLFTYRLVCGELSDCHDIF